MLKRVGFQIGERENEQSPTQVRVSAHPAANIMSRGAADPVDGALRIDGVAIHGDLVALGNPRGFAGHGKTERLRISLRVAEPGVQQAAPEIQQFRVA